MSKCEYSSAAEVEAVKRHTKGKEYSNVRLAGAELPPSSERLAPSSERLAPSSERLAEKSRTDASTTQRLEAAPQSHEVNHPNFETFTKRSPIHTALHSKTTSAGGLQFERTASSVGRHVDPVTTPTANTKASPLPVTHGISEQRNGPVIGSNNRAPSPLPITTSSARPESPKPADRRETHRASVVGPVSLLKSAHSSRLDAVHIKTATPSSPLRQSGSLKARLIARLSLLKSKLISQTLRLGVRLSKAPLATSLRLPSPRIPLKHRLLSSVPTATLTLLKATQASLIKTIPGRMYQSIGRLSADRLPSPTKAHLASQTPQLVSASVAQSPSRFSQPNRVAIRTIKVSRRGSPHNSLGLIKATPSANNSAPLSQPRLKSAATDPLPLQPQRAPIKAAQPSPSVISTTAKRATLRPSQPVNATVPNTPVATKLPPNQANSSYRAHSIRKRLVRANPRQRKAKRLLTRLGTLARQQRVNFSLLLAEYTKFRGQKLALEALIFALTHELDNSEHTKFSTVAALSLTPGDLTRIEALRDEILKGYKLAKERQNRSIEHLAVENSPRLNASKSSAGHTLPQ